MDGQQVSQSMFNINMDGTVISTSIDPQILGQFWTTLAIQLSPTNDMIGIPGDTFRVLDDGGKHFIAHNFAFAIGDAVVKFVIDGSGTHPDRYFLGRASAFNPQNIVTQAGQLDVWVPPGFLGPNGNTGTQGLTATQDLPRNNRRNFRNGAVKVPRPPNAYILYRKDHHKAVKQSNPKLSNNEISIILGRRWNDETDEIRMHYHLMAVEIKRRVEQLHPNYKYNPRKSSEIRRRSRGNHGVYNVQSAMETSNASGEQEATSMPTPPLDFGLSSDILHSAGPDDHAEQVHPTLENSSGTLLGSSD